MATVTNCQSRAKRVRTSQAKHRHQRHRAKWSKRLSGLKRPKPLYQNTRLRPESVNAL